MRNPLNTEHIAVEMWLGQGPALLSDLLLFLTTHVDLCHKELESHAELKLTNMASPPTQLNKEQITCTIHHNKALKGEKREYHFQDVVGVLFRCRSWKTQIFTSRAEKLMIEEESSRDTFLSYLAVTKKTLFVDYFHFLLASIAMATFRNGSPKCQCVCVKGHMNYGLTLTEGLILIDPELIIFGRPQSLPVSRCYNVDAHSIHRLVDAPANERL